MLSQFQAMIQFLPPLQVFYPQENEEKLSLLFTDVTSLPNLLLVLV